jgi:glycosyltransferase involved in cell wall biosynthesis
MRILAVCTSSQIYGAETVLLHLLKGLQDEGHEVVALTSIWTDGKFPARLQELGIHYQALPLGKMSKTLRWPYVWWTTQVLARLPELWWKFQRQRDCFQPDLTLFTSPQQILSLWPLLGGEPVLMLTQFSPRVGDLRTERFWRFLSRKISLWIACSAYIKRRLESLGIPADQVQVVRSATLLPADVQPGPLAPRYPLILGMAGQIGAWKGHEDFYEAAALLLAKGHEFRIQLYGEGTAEFKATLQSLAEKLGIATLIENKGYVDSKAAVYQSIDICVVPSRFEDPYPTVVMEAASFGVPVVGSDRGGLPELIVDGETGFIVPSGNPAALAARLEVLLLHEALRRKQGQAAIHRASTVFQRQRMIEDFTIVVRLSSSSKLNLPPRTVS